MAICSDGVGKCSFRMDIRDSTGMSFMRHIILSLVAILLSCDMNAIAGPPTIVFESVFIDFGKVDKGLVLKYIFKFKNKGESTLEIIEVRPG